MNREKILDKLGQLLHPDYYVAYEVTMNEMRDFINSLPQKDEVYPKCSRCSLYLEMGDDWRDMSKKLVDEYIKRTTNYQNQIAERMIGEAIRELNIVNEFSLTTLRMVTDWLEGRE